MLENEIFFWSRNLLHVAGIDEVGRGALAGPVVAAAVILPQYATINGVCDSKKLKKRARENILKKIYEIAVDFGVGYAEPAEIDELNILNASLLAMNRALDALKCIPHAILVDGQYRLPGQQCPQLAIVKGDQKSQSIAAASILAKVTRDQFMQQLGHEHPGYGWEPNVGYPTKHHYLALRQLGPSIHHRRTFRLV